MNDELDGTELLDSMIAEDVAMQAIDDRVAARIEKDTPGKKVRVDYSAYESTDDDIPIDNLDTIPISGKIRIREESEEFWGGKKSSKWESPILENATWLDLCVQANNMIRRVRDTHHCFLEAIDVVGQEGDITICEFGMGS